MTTTPNDMNQFGAIPCFLSNGFQKVGPSNMVYQVNPQTNMVFTNQLYPAYSQQLPQNYFYNPYFQNIFPIPINFSGTSGQAPINLIGRSHSPPPPKIQKRKTSSQVEFVNLISDQEEPLQPEKPCEDKNTTSNSKSNEYNGTTKFSPLPNQTLNQHIPKKSRKTQEPSIPSKTEKLKEIPKHKHINKKQKKVNETIRSSIKKGSIFSQRIVERQYCKKQPFKISKRERQQLEINNLRDFQRVILTGPHFQAKVPSFISQGPDLRTWLANKKQDLLCRICEQDSDDE